MVRISKKLLTVFIILLGVAAILGLKQYLGRTPVVPPIDPVAARTTGNPSAEIHIVEYMDFQCPACAKGVGILKQYLAAFPDKIYLEVKYFPLGMHVHGFRSAQFAHCTAKQGRFWPYFDLLIERQDQWKRLINADPAFQEMAVEAGINTEQLDVCLKDPAVDEAINSEKAHGAALGVESTPTYFVNNEMVVGFKSLQQILQVKLGDVNLSP